MKWCVVTFVLFIVMTFVLVDAAEPSRSKQHSQLLYERENGNQIWIFSYMRVKFNEEEDFTFHRHTKIPKPMKIFYENGKCLSIKTNGLEYIGVHYDFDTMFTCIISETNCVPNAFISTFR